MHVYSVVIRYSGVYTYKHIHTYTHTYTHIHTHIHTCIHTGAEGESAVEEWRRLQKYMEPLARASVALPPAAIRFDVGILATLFRYVRIVRLGCGVFVGHMCVYVRFDVGIVAILFGYDMH